MSNVDDPEWIKGLVAKALLHATDDRAPTDAAPPESAPAERAESAWPELVPLDTSAIARARDLTHAGPTDAPVVDASPAESVPVATAASPAVVSPVPTAAPADVPEAVLDSIAAQRHEHVAQRPVESPSATLEPSTPERLDRPVDEPLAPNEPPEHDAVMVEEEVTTEGFRSSDIRTVLEWLAVIVSALVVALVIKAVVLQAFWIPSESMETTVNKGDRILVNKVSYRLHEVRRGDLVVFEKLEGTPGDTKDLIKRAIALPGETIEVRADGRIWIWGPGETPDDAKLLEEPYLDPQNAVLNPPSASDPLTADIWDERCVNQPRTPGRCQLDESSYFMMGDNRNRSSDSRFFGPVPDENVVGRAFLRIWPLGDIGTL